MLAFDPKPFTAFEKQSWERISNEYHHAFHSLTCQTVDVILNAINLNQGITSLLDLATGPGYLAKTAAEHGCNKVTGLDFSETMIALANSLKEKVNNPNLLEQLKFKLGNAEEIDEPNNSFEAVTMNFGLLHLGKPHNAIMEAYRVLKPGHRFGFTIWSKPEQSIGFNIVLSAISTFADDAIKLPEGPPFFHFSELENCQIALQNAGFMDISLEEIPLLWKLPSGDALFEGFLEGSARTGGLLRLQPPEILNLIKNDILKKCECYRQGAEIHLPMSAVLAVGTKPMK